jgi:hypothetical protein
VASSLALTCINLNIFHFYTEPFNHSTIPQFLKFFRQKICNKQIPLDHKNCKRHHHEVKCSSFNPTGTLFFNIIFKHINKVAPFWHKFEDSTVVKIVSGIHICSQSQIFTSSL